MRAVLTLYAVRNREGRWFRSRGARGYGDTWTPDIGKAKLYTKIGQARGRVSFHGADDYVDIDVAQA